MNDPLSAFRPEAILRHIQRTPAQRLSFASEAPNIDLNYVDVARILGARHNVDYIVMGFVAAALRGLPLHPTCFEIAVGSEPDNLERATNALTEISSIEFSRVGDNSSWTNGEYYPSVVQACVLEPDIYESLESACDQMWIGETTMTVPSIRVLRELNQLGIEELMSEPIEPQSSSSPFTPPEDILVLRELDIDLKALEVLERQSPASSSDL